MDPNLDPTTQPQPDRQYWDGDKPVEHDTAELAQPSPVEVLQHKLALMQGALVATIAVMTLTLIHAIVTKTRLDNLTNSAIAIAKGVNNANERLDAHARQLRQLQVTSKLNEDELAAISQLLEQPEFD